jgi:hypothetical protein
VNILIQLNSNHPKTIKELSLFVIHQSKFSTVLKTFIHHLIVIGYAGGGVQEEAFYRVEGSKIKDAKIFYSTVSGPGILEYKIDEEGASLVDIPLFEDSEEFQKAALALMPKYISFIEEQDIFMPINNEKKFEASPKFPTYFLRSLQNVYWPFSHLINDKFPYPDFITPLMKMWLAQYESDVMEKITVLGIFEWEFFPNKKNRPRRRRRVNRIAEVDFNVPTQFKRRYYFLQIDESTLHVYAEYGFSKAGSARADEYTFKEGSFVKGEHFLYRIS